MSNHPAPIPVRAVDPYSIIRKIDNKARIDAWVVDNSEVVNKLWKRFTGEEATLRQMRRMAVGGAKNKDLVQKLAIYRELNPYYDAYEKYYGPVKSPSWAGKGLQKVNPKTYQLARKVAVDKLTQNLIRIKNKFPSADEYAGWLSAADQATAVMPEINELWEISGKKVPKKSQIQGYIYGRKGGVSFQQKLELARTIKKGLWADSQVDSGIQMGKAGPSMSLLGDYL